MKRSWAVIPTLVLVFVFLLGAPVFAANSGGLNGEARMADLIVSLYWRSVSMGSEIESNGGNCGETFRGEYLKVVAAMETLQKELASRIITDMDSGRFGSLKNFSGSYKERQHFDRLPLYPICEAVTGRVRTEMMNGGRVTMNALGVVSEENFRAEYFPGYGYAEPGYKYRKGRELEAIHLNAYWQDEEKMIETAKHFKGVIDIKVGAGLRDSGNVTNYVELSPPFKLDVGGHFIMAVEASFDTTEKLTTVARKKYATTKVWFELFRHKTFGSEWELCGKTFEMQELFTNEEVIAQVKIGK